MLWKCCTQYASKFGKLSNGHRTGKGQFSFQSQSSNAKECSNYCTIALISHASKVMLKILQARLQQYVNRELPDVQAGFRKGRGTRDQIANVCWIIKKAIEFQKNIYFCFIDDSADVGNLISGSFPFLKPCQTFGSSWFTYGWNLVWRILSITLLACEMSAIVQ